MNRPQQSQTGRRRRGVAMLLVMIALVVGTILTAGFLGTQSTSIGIARNQRDHDRARAVAESGAELCMSLVRNKPNWRSTMSPGPWLNNYSLAGGSVTVMAADSAGNGSFMTDTTHPVKFTSTGTVGGRSFTVIASMIPTGGGYPWSGGVFAKGQIELHDTYVLMDSYDSSQGAYQYPGFKCQAWSDVCGTPAGLQLDSGLFLGTFMISPLQSLSNAYTLKNGIAPLGVSPATEPRSAGHVIKPNVSGLTDTHANYAVSGKTQPVTYDAIYSDYSISGSNKINTSLTIARDTTYYVKGNFTIDSFSSLVISNGYNVVYIVDGNVTLQGSISLKPQATLQIYCGGQVDLSGTGAMGAQTDPSRLMLLGMSGCNQLRIHDSTTVSAAVLAPDATVDLSDSSVFCGSMVVNNLQIREQSRFHMDVKTTTVPFHYMTGGSFMGDYLVKWQQ